MKASEMTIRGSRSSDCSAHTVRVCVLAYNEQKHIADTVKAILAGNGELDVQVVVYANGCTDQTAEVVRTLQKTTPCVSLRELSKASKPHAWNTAFAENADSLLFFSDGDVRPEPGSVAALRRQLTERPELALICSQFWPSMTGLALERWLTGLCQVPLAQTFHAGGFYAIRRDRIETLLRQKGLGGLPEGMVGEDVFLEVLAGPREFLVARERFYYEPPGLDDYCRYLARIRWQEEQVRELYSELFADELAENPLTWRGRLAVKLAARQRLRRTFLGIVTTVLRSVMSFLLRRRINRCYRELGPVGREGEHILSERTRSGSTK